MKALKQIWKYEISPYNPEIQIPKGAEILTVQVQNDKPNIWCLVDPVALKETRKFIVVGTGHNFPHDENIIYRGTFQLEEGSLVFHVFEDVSQTI